jgi:hypothetical protein
VLNQLQLAVIKAAERQDFEPAELYPEGISLRTSTYELPSLSSSMHGTHEAMAAKFLLINLSG